MEVRGELPARELQVFLALADDPHFGRVGDRLFLSQPHVSRTLAALERRVGGPLVDRNGHRLTELGEGLAAELRPAYDDLLAAIERTRARAAGDAATLRLGCTASATSTVLAELAEAYEQSGGRLQIVEITAGSPYRSLRDGDIDVLVWLRSGEDRDLVFGPTVEVQSLVVGMGAEHPLAEMDVVNPDDAVDYGFIVPTYDGQPADFAADKIPLTASDGRVIPRHGPTPTLFHEAAYDLARSTRLFPVLSGVARVYAYRADVTFRPLVGAPPLEIALIWMRSREDDRIRELAAAAETLTPEGAAS